MQLVCGRAQTQKASQARYVDLIGREVARQKMTDALAESRPATTSAVARRLIHSHLNVPLSAEMRTAERTLGRK